MSQTEYIDVAALDQVPVGSVRSVTVGEKRLTLYRTAGGIFASDDRCPHRGGPLSEGDLIGCEIVCPWHLWSFNVETGENPAGPEYSLARHEVRVEGDRILLKLSADASQTLP